MCLGHCSKVVSTVYTCPDLPSCRRHQKAPLGASSGSHGKASRGHASRGHFESVAAVQVRRARPAHSCAPCLCRRDWVRFRTRACSSTASRASIRDGRLRLTTLAGGPSTTGTQIFSSTFLAGLWSLSACVACACPRAGQGHSTSA